MSASKQDDFVTLQVCNDHIAAEVLANFLRAQGLPALIRNLGIVPGLEQGTEVLVPAEFLRRARELLSSQRPSDAELESLATASPAEPKGT